MCRWMLGEETLPGSVFSIGGRFGYDDDGETPNTQIAVYDYASAPLIFEVRGLPAKADVKHMDHYRGVRIGIAIECEHGTFAGGAGGGVVYDQDGKRVKSVHVVRRRHAHGELHPGRPQPKCAGPESADRWGRTSRRPCATLATSPTAWARRRPRRRSPRG